MANQRFHRVYPPSGKTLFDGGKNSKYEKSIIEDNESPDCANVVFDAGSVGTRGGFVKVNTAAVGTYVCDGLYTRKGSGNAETMVGFWNGTAYDLQGTSFITIGSGQSVFTGGVRVCSDQMENHIFFCNGNVNAYKWNGTDWTLHGIPAATGAISVATGAAGNPNGAYSYKITYVNSQSVEFNPSDAQGSITVASERISITSIPVAPQSYGVASRRIYRTVTSGTTFFRVATISDNTTTTYSDNIADASLGAELSSDQNQPPIYSHIKYHQNRLFMIGNDNLIWYTDVNEPYDVPALNFLTVGDQSTDFPVALGVFADSLVVFGQQNIWLVYMVDSDPANWKIVKCQSAYTTKSPYAVFNYNNKLAFAAMQNDKFVGFAALTGNVIEPTASLLTVNTAGSELKSDRVEPDMFLVQESYVKNISSIVFKNKAYITFTKDASETQNNYIYTMDFSISSVSKNQTEAWVPWTGLNAAQFTVYGGNLYYAESDTSGFVFKYDEDVYADNGAAINSYYWTKEFSGSSGETSISKDFRYVNLLVDLAGAYYMSVAARTDSDQGSGTNYQIDLDPESRLWGSMVFGVDTWGAGPSQSDKRLYLAGARGKRVQFKFSNQNTVNQRFKVHWQNFTYNLKGPR